MLTGLSGLTGLSALFGGGGTPDSVSSLALWVEASSQYAKTGGSRLCVAAGDDYFTRNDDAQLETTDEDVTIAVWLYPVTITQDACIYIKGNSADNAQDVRFFLNSNGTISFGFYDGSVKVATSTDTVTAGQWNLVIGYRDNTAKKHYVQVNNGTPVGTAYTGSVPATAGPSFMGGYVWAAGVLNEYNGRMACGAMWKRLLTAAEKTFLYNSGSGKYYGDIGVAATAGSALKTSLTAWWQFNDAANANAVDIHGAHDLTDTNGVGAADGPSLGTPVTGDRIHTLYSRDGKGYTFTNATAAARPLFTAASSKFNNRPIITFDGSDDILIKSGVVSDASLGTILAAYLCSASPSDQQTIFAQSDEASINRFMLVQGYYTTVLPVLRTGQQNGAAEDAIRGNTAVTVNTTHVALWGSSGTAYTMKLDNVAQSKTVVLGADTGDWFGDTTGEDNTTLGAMKTSAGVVTKFKGALAELMVYDKVLSAAEITSLQSYLANKYGVTLS